MGQSKNIHLQLQEEISFRQGLVEPSIEYLNSYSLSKIKSTIPKYNKKMRLTKELYQELEFYFIEFANQVEEGNLCPLDLAARFHEEMSYLSTMLESRKAWLNRNADLITDKAQEYGPDGYKGLLFKKQSRETLSYKHIPQWWSLEQQQKQIEEQAKQALKSVRNGILNVTPDGEEITLPEVKTSSFIKIERVKPLTPLKN